MIKPNININKKDLIIFFPNKNSVIFSIIPCSLTFCDNPANGLSSFASTSFKFIDFIKDASIVLRLRLFSYSNNDFAIGSIVVLKHKTNGF